MGLKLNFIPKITGLIVKVIPQVKNALGPVWIFVVFAVLALGFLTLARFGLSVWQGERVFGSHAWFSIFVGGLRVDIATLSYIIMPVLLLTLLMQSVGWQNKIRSLTWSTKFSHPS